MRMKKARKRAKALIMEDYNYTNANKADNRRKPMEGGTLGEYICCIDSIYKENLSVCTLELYF